MITDVYSLTSTTESERGGKGEVESVPEERVLCGCFSVSHMAVVIEV
jgi:hypothetical protein